MVCLDIPVFKHADETKIPRAKNSAVAKPVNFGNPAVSIFQLSHQYSTESFNIERVAPHSSKLM